MGQGHNVLMIDLRLPSYDIMEGPKLYDIFAAYNFCSFLSEKLRERNLIRKSLVLVRNEKERAEIGRAVRANEGSDLQANESKIVQVNDASDVSAGNDVDEFRQKLMSSWDTLADDSGGESKLDSTSSLSESKMDTGVNNDANNANVNYKSHRLWSMVGNEEISTGPDMFEQAIAAVDKHARLEVDGQSAEPEDALIILSPYDTTDVIAIRRILERYGQTRTIIIVNSRMESLPRELDPAVLVYGIMPLIARARGSNEDNSDGREAGPKVVVMRRFPKKWTVFLDVNDEGFVDVTGESPSGAEGSKTFPPIEWVVQRVQSHIENMSTLMVGM